MRTAAAADDVTAREASVAASGADESGVDQTAGVALPEVVAFAPTPRAKHDLVRPEEGGNVLSALGLEPVLPAARAKGDRPIRARTPEIDALIAKYAAVYELPVDFVHKVVKRESTYNPKAFNKGHWGLMQIKHATARGMGYDGPAKGLLDPETNLKFAVKYLKGAYMVADGNEKLADRMYQRGYYYDAKRKGLLDETGLGRDKVRKRGA
ncbi:MAG: lytic transglycosylase domain-containing protein [Rhizobiaceae bacterium]|nr:lytic transglycosylase domain-containing protein [Rhizobiaceae bacterium]